LYVPEYTIRSHPGVVILKSGKDTVPEEKTISPLVMLLRIVGAALRTTSVTDHVSHWSSPLDVTHVFVSMAPLVVRTHQLETGSIIRSLIGTTTPVIETPESVFITTEPVSVVPVDTLPD
jgi:hypothetical protein